MSDPDVIEADLDEPTSPTARVFPMSRGLVGLVVGLLIGGVLVHVWDSRSEVVPQPVPVVQSLQLGLGASIEDRYTPLPRVGPRGRSTIVVPAVVTNRGPAPVSIVSVRADGPGAALSLDVDAIARADLPVLVGPGDTRDLPFVLTSDCTVAVRPVPRIVLTVVDRNGPAREVAVEIPDLDRLWGRTLAPQVCAAA